MFPNPLNLFKGLCCGSEGCGREVPVQKPVCRAGKASKMLTDAIDFSMKMESDPFSFEDDPVKRLNQLSAIFQMCDTDQDSRLNRIELNWMAFLLTQRLLDDAEYNEVCRRYQAETDIGLVKAHVIEFFTSNIQLKDAQEFLESCQHARSITEKARNMHRLCNARKTGHLTHAEHNWMRAAIGPDVVMSTKTWDVASRHVKADPKVGWTVMELIQCWQWEIHAHANQKVEPIKDAESALAAARALLDEYIVRCHDEVTRRDEILQTTFDIVDQNRDGYLSLAELNWFQQAVGAKTVDPAFFKEVCTRVGSTDTRIGLNRSQFLCLLQYNDLQHKFTANFAQKLLDLVTQRDKERSASIPSLGT